MNKIILTNEKPSKYKYFNHQSKVIWCSNFERHTRFTIGGYIVEFNDRNGNFLFRTKINSDWSLWKCYNPERFLINLAINKYVYHTYGASVASVGNVKELRAKLRSNNYTKTIYINYDGKWNEDGYLLPNKHDGHGSKTLTLDENVWNPNDFKENVYIVKFEKEKNEKKL